MTPSRSRRVVAALSISAAVLLLAPGAVLAHAELDTATPADKATVPPPAEIVLTFTENLDPAKSSIKLADSGGGIVAEGSTVDTDNRKTMRLALPDLAAGAYTVRWISASADDGDLDKGTTTFTVSAPTAPPPSVAPSAAASTAPSTAPTPSPTTAPTVAPSPSPPPATPASSTSDALIPIAVVLVILAGLGLWLATRTRRRLT